MTDSLNEFIELRSLTAVNEHPEHRIENAFKEDQSYVESYTDDELIVHFAFKQSVKVEAIQLVPEDKEYFPGYIKIFVNQEVLDFGNAEIFRPSCDIICSQIDQNLTIKVPKGRANCITLFCQKSLGDKDTIRIAKIRAIGRPCEATNLSEWKPVSKEAQYAPEE